MLRISKSEFNRAIESNSDLRANLKHTLTVPLQPEPKHTSRIIPIIFAIMMGLGAGWLGGRVLNGQMSKSSVDVTASDKPVVDVSTPHPSAETQSPTNQSSNRASDVTADAKRSVARPSVAADSTSTEPEPPQNPPKPKSVDKDAASEGSTTQEPVKEIGREALKKISQDVKEMRRKPANKNENENQPK